MGTLSMSAKERVRIVILAQVTAGSLSLSAASAKLGVSYRQMRRIRQRHADAGDAGLAHRLRGQASNRKTDDALRRRVLALCRDRFAGFGPTLVAEYLLTLGEEDGGSASLSPDTVRRWLIEEKLMPRRRRRRGKHRSRRERRGRPGELVQMDGSWHDWFEGRRAWCCLMVMIDDATGRLRARFYERETLAAAFDVFGRYAGARGLPLALYVDRAGIYRSDKEPTPEQELAGERPATQFGRAMRDLGVELILANSPQAKGRVERVNQTLQDRLVKAMRLAGIDDIEAANRWLDGSFLGSFNERFVVAAADAADGHRAVGVDVRLAEVLCEHRQRKVGRDWRVQWRGTLLQIDKSHEALRLAGETVTVTVRDVADGTVQLVWAEQALAWTRVAARPKRAKARPPIVNNTPWRPGPNHPWRGSDPAARGSPPTAPRPLPRG